MQLLTINSFCGGYRPEETAGGPIVAQPTSAVGEFAALASKWVSNSCLAFLVGDWCVVYTFAMGPAAEPHPPRCVSLSAAGQGQSRESMGLRAEHPAPIYY